MAQKDAHWLEPADDILQRFIKRKGKEFNISYSFAYIKEHWPQAVGEYIAAQVIPLRLEKYVLYLKASSTSWQMEIKADSCQIIDKINQQAGMELVRELKFISNVFGNYKEKSYKFENNSESWRNRLSMVKPVSPLEKEGIKAEITSDEGARVKKSVRHISDEQLREHLQRAGEGLIKLKKARYLNQWHECAECGQLCPPDELYCNRCSIEMKERKKQKIASILRDQPWMRYSDIKKQLDCTAYEVNSVRSDMVHRLSSVIGLEEMKQRTLKVKYLTMLFRCLPPEQLNDSVVDDAMFQLRYDIKYDDGNKDYFNAYRQQKRSRRSWERRHSQ